MASEDIVNFMENFWQESNEECIEMLVKEWITDDKGRICATWVQRPTVSVVKFDLPGGYATKTPESIALPTEIVEKAVGVYAAVQQPLVLRKSRPSTPVKTCKDGIWTSLFLALRSVLT